MPETVTLHCAAGDHEWERLKQRGRRPVNCPNCEPVLSPQQQSEASRLEKMRAGREAANARKREEAVARVEAFRQWVRDDVVYQKYCNRLEAYGAEIAGTPVPKPVLEAIPSDYDYRVTRGEETS